MAKRTVCEYNGGYIGIEEIFTVVDGKQVNIPGKVEWLRKLGRENQLFCPCGCGNNLVVVAGDSGLREQHFRMKENTNEQVRECTAVFESEESILSKIALKCWLDEKLGRECVSTRVMLKDIADTERKFEISFYSKKHKLALCFWNDRSNIDSEKISTIQQCEDIRTKIYIVSDFNSGTAGKGGQYPEYMMKLQKVQGYGLYLQLKSFNIDQVYEGAMLKVITFVRHVSGIWKEIPVLAEPLKNYQISADGNLMYNDCKVEEYVQATIIEFTKQESECRKKYRNSENYISKTIKKIESEKKKTRGQEPERDETPEEKMARKIRENDEWLAEQEDKNRRRKGL